MVATRRRERLPGGPALLGHALNDAVAASQYLLRAWSLGGLCRPDVGWGAICLIFRGGVTLPGKHRPGLWSRRHRRRPSAEDRGCRGGNSLYRLHLRGGLVSADLAGWCRRRSVAPALARRIGQGLARRIV